jgi:hypothetical protein
MALSGIAWLICYLLGIKIRIFGAKVDKWHMDEEIKGCEKIKDIYEDKK